MFDPFLAFMQYRCMPLIANFTFLTYGWRWPKIKVAAHEGWCGWLPSITPSIQVRPKGFSLRFEWMNFPRNLIEMISVMSRSISQNFIKVGEMVI